MRFGLQAKTTLTLIAILVPLVTLFAVQRTHVERNARHEQRIERTLTRVTANPERLCRRKQLPARQNNQLRGATLALYASDNFAPLGEEMPALSSTQREQLQALAIDEIAHFPPRLLRPDEPNAPHGYTLTRFEGEDARCNVAMLTWPRAVPRLNEPTSRIVLPQAGVLTLLLLLTGLLISVPLVRRIKRLTRAVQEATSTTHWRLAHVADHGTDELGDLARAFDHAGEEIQNKIQELESRDHTLKEYISNTTHDLAIPLTVVQHRLRRIQLAAREGAPIELEWIDGAMEESHYIAALIANMSALAKLEAGSVHQLSHPVNLGEIVERVIARHEPIAAQRNLELAWSVPSSSTWTDGDSTLIERALSNLVQNAIQYNDSGGHIAVVLEHESATTCSLRVMDDGPGVPEHMLGRLGERAARGDDARNRNPGGQGFGLSIVHKVCAQHAWLLRFESEEDQGLTAIIDHIKLGEPPAQI